MNWTHRQYTIGFGIGFDRGGEPIHTDKVAAALTRIRQAALQQFGGFTLINTDGGWIDPDVGIAHCEAGYSLSILIERYSVDPKVINLIQFARYVGRQLNQASVILINPDGEAMFIDPDGGSMFSDIDCS